MKKFLSLILTFTMFCSLVFITPTFASTKSTNSVNSTVTSNKTMNITFNSGKSNTGNNSTMTTDSIGFELLVVTGKFTSSGSFTISCKNLWLYQLDSVIYDYTVYDSSGDVIAGGGNNIGAIGAFATVTDKYYYAGAYKVAVTVTVIGNGEEETKSGSFTA